MSHITHYIDRDEGELELSVTYTISKYYSATYEQPEEGGEVEFLATHLGAEIDLTDAEREAIELACMEDAAERQEAAEDMRAEWRREELMEERL